VARRNAAGDPAPGTTYTAAPDPAIYANWRINLLFIWFGVFVGLMGANFVFPFIPFFIKDLGVTDQGEIGWWTSLSASATGLSLTITAPIWGTMADRYGRKPMFVRALLGAGVLILIMGATQAPWQFVALRFLMGAFAGTMGAAAALVAATTPRERVGYALGLLQTGQFMANTLGPFIGGMASAAFGIRNSFFFCGALYLAAVALAFVFVKESKGTIVPDAPGQKHKGGSLAGNIRLVVSERQVVVMLGFLFFLWLSTQFVRPVMPISIDDFASHVGDRDSVTLVIGGWSRSFDEKFGTGLVYGMIGLTSTFAALSVAPLGARIGYKRCVTAAAVLTGLLFIPVAVAGSYTTFLLWMGATGLFQGAMVPGTNALIAASVPDGKQGAAFGLAASMQSMALLIGPLAGGAVNDGFGIQYVYIVMGVILMATGVIGSMLIREPELFTRARPARAAHG